jgi:hypothetical protein
VEVEGDEDEAKGEWDKAGDGDWGVAIREGKVEAPGNSGK